jgi:hypothetical protein
MESQISGERCLVQSNRISRPAAPPAVRASAVAPPTVADEIVSGSLRGSVVPDDGFSQIVLSLFRAQDNS